MLLLLKSVPGTRYSLAGIIVAMPPTTVAAAAATMATAAVHEELVSLKEKTRPSFLSGCSSLGDLDQIGRDIHGDSGTRGR